MGPDQSAGGDAHAWTQRDLFDIPRDICCCSASYSPLPLQTLEAGRDVAKGQPWRLDPGFAGRQHDRARVAAARLINADAADIALIPRISSAWRRRPFPDHPEMAAMLVLENDHDSPVLEWQTRADAHVDRRDHPPGR